MARVDDATIEKALAMAEDHPGSVLPATVEALLDLRDARELLRDVEECEVEVTDSDGYCLSCHFPVPGAHGDSCGLMLLADVCARIRQHLEGSDEHIQG